MAKAKAKAPGKVLIYRAKVSFHLGDTFVRAGDSIVADHPIMKGRGELFEPFQPDHGKLDWEADEAPADGAA